MAETQTIYVSDQASENLESQATASTPAEIISDLVEEHYSGVALTSDLSAAVEEWSTRMDELSAILSS